MHADYDQITTSQANCDQNSISRDGIWSHSVFVAETGTSNRRTYLIDGQLFIALRQTTPYGQDAFAEVAQVSPETIQRIEQNVAVSVFAKTAVKLAAVFKMSVDEFADVVARRAAGPSQMTGSRLAGEAARGADSIRVFIRHSTDPDELRAMLKLIEERLKEMKED